MATRLYHYDLTLDALAGTPRLITQEAGSATTNGMELTVDLAKLTDRQQVLQGLDTLKNYLLQNNWPPA